MQLPPDPGRRQGSTAFVAVVLGCLGCVLLDLGPAPVAPLTSAVARTALWALLWAGTCVLVLRRARSATGDGRLWWALLRLVVPVGAAVMVQPLLALALPGSAGSSASMVPIAVAVLVSSLTVYGAFVRWNLARTHSSDPGDVLNGTSAVLAGQALFTLLPHLLGSPLAGLPWWQLQSMAAAAAAVVVLTGTVLSTALVVGGGRDRYTWLFVGACGAMVVGVACVALSPLAGSGGTPPGALAAWSLAAACLALSAVRWSSVPVPGVFDGASVSVGAFCVCLLALAVLVVDALAGPTSGQGLWTLVTAALGAAGGATRLVLNITELGQLSLTRHEALTDELTGLANRRGVLRRVDAHVAAGVPFALAVVDLDRFKEVNDGLGHGAGDQLLVEVGRRLRGVGGSGAAPLVGRLGGDEFAVLVPLPLETAAPAGGQTVGEAVGEAAARAWGERLVEALFPVYALDGGPVHVGCSVGIGVHLPGGSAAGEAPGEASGEVSGEVVRAELLRRADAAMYAAKRSGGGAALYDPALHAVAHHGLQIAEELRRALVCGELVLHHQPQLDVATGAVVGVEALVRWQHPQRGLLGPGEFLVAAEGHGLMGVLTADVLAQAVRQAAAWRRQGLDLRISVNLSATNLADRSLPGDIAALLMQHSLPASRLVLEVTETVLVRDDERTTRVLAELADLGLEMSIDDFGTGYSSLAQLHRMHFTELKLDRSFTLDLLSDPRAAAITASTVDLAHALGLRVVAEGVEDEATFQRLAELGCDESQGWLHARAMPADELAAWVVQHHAVLVSE